MTRARGLLLFLGLVGSAQAWGGLLSPLNGIAPDPVGLSVDDPVGVPGLVGGGTPGAPGPPSIDPFSIVHPEAILGYVDGVAPSDPPDLDEPPTSCGGTAPLTTTCEQRIMASAGQAYELLINVGTGFTGTVAASLADGQGNWHGVTCTYLAFVGGVTPAPSCQANGSGTLQPGELLVVGAVQSVEQGGVSAGYWEAKVQLG